MIPEPIPVAVPPKAPRFVAICEVSVRTESFVLATTAVMSSSATEAVPVVAVGACAATLAFVAAVGVPDWPCGIDSSTIARVEPDARTAARTAAPTTVPTDRREPLRGEASTGLGDGIDRETAVGAAEARCHALGEGSVVELGEADQGLGLAGMGNPGRTGSGAQAGVWLGDAEPAVSNGSRGFIERFSGPGVGVMCSSHSS